MTGSMRVLVLTSGSPFLKAVCEGVHAGGGELIAVGFARSRARGVLRARRGAGRLARRVYPSLFSRLSRDPVHLYLHRRGIRGVALPRVHHPRFVATLTRLRPDLILVSRFGEIFPSTVLDVPPLGVVNIHCSLLPRLRGPEPIAGAIISGLSESGVTVHFVDPGIDTGDLISQRGFALGTLETLDTFCAKARDIMGSMVATAMRQIESGTVHRTRQDPALASYFSLRRIFGTARVAIDWTQSADLISAFLRAGVRCVTSYGTRSFQVRGTGVIRRDLAAAQPGAVIASEESGLLVSAGDCALGVRLSREPVQGWCSFGDEVEPQGHKCMHPRDLPVPGARLDSVSWPALGSILDGLRHGL